MTLPRPSSFLARPYESLLEQRWRPWTAETEAATPPHIRAVLGSTGRLHARQATLEQHVDYRATGCKCPYCDAYRVARELMPPLAVFEFTMPGPTEGWIVRWYVDGHVVDSTAHQWIGAGDRIRLRLPAQTLSALVEIDYTTHVGRDKRTMCPIQFVRVDQDG